MPPADDRQSVDAFLGKGGEHWKTDVGDGGTSVDEPLWIWPVADGPIAASQGSKFRPFGLHWRLKTGKSLPAGAVVCMIRNESEVVPLRHVQAGSARDGIVGVSLPIQDLGLVGRIRICLVSPGPPPRRASNAMELTLSP
jgi:hypothetical protein